MCWIGILLISRMAKIKTFWELSKFSNLDWRLFRGKREIRVWMRIKTFFILRIWSKKVPFYSQNLRNRGLLRCALLQDFRDNCLKIWDPSSRLCIDNEAMIAEFRAEICHQTTILLFKMLPRLSTQCTRPCVVVMVVMGSSGMVKKLKLTPYTAANSNVQTTRTQTLWVTVAALTRPLTILEHRLHHFKRIRHCNKKAKKDW